MSIRIQNAKCALSVPIKHAAVGIMRTEWEWMSSSTSVDGCWTT
jgi:hypothetical protein